MGCNKCKDLSRRTHRTGRYYFGNDCSAYGHNNGTIILKVRTWMHACANRIPRISCRRTDCVGVPNTPKMKKGNGRKRAANGDEDNPVGAKRKKNAGKDVRESHVVACCSTSSL